MRFEPTAIGGVLIVDADVFPDDRGAFVRLWLPEEFRAQGLDTSIAQVAMAVNHRRGTLRGLHYQADPLGELKVVRVTSGAVFDVAVDLRRDSPTFRRWVGVELNAGNRRGLCIPPGCAHGYQTLSDNSDLLYLVSSPYSPDHQRGVRWNDPAFAIDWPLGPPTVIHPRDASYPDFEG